MQLGYAVNVMTDPNTQVRHLNLVIRDDGHLAYAVPLARELLPQPGALAAVHLLQDHVDPRQ